MRYDTNGHFLKNIFHILYRISLKSRHTSKSHRPRNIKSCCIFQLPHPNKRRPRNLAAWYEVVNIRLLGIPICCRVCAVFQYAQSIMVAYEYDSMYIRTYIHVPTLPALCLSSANQKKKKDKLILIILLCWSKFLFFSLPR